MKTVTGMILIAIGAFMSGWIVKPAPELEIRQSESPGWIEVWRNGELSSEWCDRDGDTWRVLTDVLYETPALYELKTTPRLRNRPGRTA